MLSSNTTNPLGLRFPYIIRAPPLCGGRPIVISLSVHPSVTNRVRAVTFHIWHVGRPPPDDVLRTIVGDL